VLSHRIFTLASASDPLHAPPTIARVAPSPYVNRQYPLHLPVSATLHFALASRRIQVPACPRLTHIQQRLYLSPPAYTASFSSFPSLFEFWSRLLEGCAGHVHCSIGHLEKTKAIGPNTTAPAPFQPAVAFVHTRHPHHNVGQLAASPVATVDCSSNGTLALAARSKAQKLQCRSDNTKLVAPGCCQYTRCIFVFAALQTDFQAPHIAVGAVVPTRSWFCRIAARWKVAAQDSQHRFLSTTTQTWWAIESNQSAVDEFDAWRRHGRSESVVNIQGSNAFQE